MESDDGAARPVALAIEAKLRAAIVPLEELVVENESHKHAVAAGSETHFKVILVSSSFDGVARIARHRAINDALADELAGPVHALAISAKTPAQWAKARGVATRTPPCEGAGGVER